MDHLVQIEHFGRHAEIVVLKFKLFAANEAEARRLIGTHVSAIQEEYESLARERDAEFFILTHFSAADINAKRQERWNQIAEKVLGTS